MIEAANTSFNLIYEKLSGWIKNGIAMLPNLAVALLIVIAFNYLSKGTKGLLRKVLPRFTSNASVVELFAQVAYFVIYLTGIFWALEVIKLDKTVTSLLAGIGIIGLALGLAFRDIAENFFAGLVIAFKPNIKVGDMVEVNDYFERLTELDCEPLPYFQDRGRSTLYPMP